MRTPRPVAEKLGTVSEDPDVHGLLFTLIIRATGDCQERAARFCHPQGDMLRKGVKQKPSTVETSLQCSKPLQHPKRAAVFDSLNKAVAILPRKQLLR